MPGSLTQYVSHRLILYCTPTFLQISFFLLPFLAQFDAALMALLVVEALVVQGCCALYQARLLWGVERARLVTMLLMLSLPGPVLRALATKKPKASVRFVFSCFGWPRLPWPFCFLPASPPGGSALSLPVECWCFMSDEDLIVCCLCVLLLYGPRTDPG